jgi:hypothetical protein
MRRHRDGGKSMDGTVFFFGLILLDGVAICIALSQCIGFHEGI